MVGVVVSPCQLAQEVDELTARFVIQCGCTEGFYDQASCSNGGSNGPALCIQLSDPQEDDWVASFMDTARTAFPEPVFGPLGLSLIRIVAGQGKARSLVAIIGRYEETGPRALMVHSDADAFLEANADLVKSFDMAMLGGLYKGRKGNRAVTSG